MTEYTDVLYEKSGPIATITLNRPERLNAINWPMMEAMLDRIAEAGKDEDVRVLVFTGTGRAFSAGDDIVIGMGDRTRGGEPGSISNDRGLHYEMVKALLQLPKPVVAALNGRCHGAGFVISLACDFRVGRSDALVGDIRSRRAIFAGQGAPLLLPRLIGQSRAMDLLMTGRVIDGIEAERFGYMNRVWSPEDYEQELSRFLNELAEGPTKTYAAWKLTVNRSVLLELDAYTDYERQLAILIRGTEDVTEGRASFREKRQPRFIGQ